MSRLGKSFKNRFLRQALAMVLAGTMVMTSMPVSLAAEQSDAKASVEAEVQGRTEDASEEAAEDAELSQKESVETEETESKKTTGEGDSATTKADKETDMESDASKESESFNETTAAAETEASEESETDAEEASETETSEEENEAASNTSTYPAAEGNSEELVKYNLEGFAASTNVTGGGLLTVDNSNYHKVTTEKEFLDALVAVRKAKTTPTVIEITKDMNLGSIELGEQNISVLPKEEAEKADEQTNPYCKVILKDAQEPLLHPTLKEKGVSDLMLQDIKNLTIFSKNGSAIKHCDIIIKRTENLIIRNIKFDELWEWDEDTSGAYDRNDWDYIGIEQSDGIWIDHCTFYKSYDGIIDIKNPREDKDNAGNVTKKYPSNITISWCRFLPASEGSFFQEMMDWLETNKAQTTYYKKLRDEENATPEQVRRYAYGQKKTHLLGQGDTITNAERIKLTMANNYYFDSMDRLPRLRFGTVHEYNCVLDSQDLYDWRTDITNPIRGKITSNGALSTCKGKMLLENCYIKGIDNPLVSGNDKSEPGWINAVDSLYYIGDTDKTSELKPKNNNTNSEYTGSKEALTTDEVQFVKDLPYSDYIKYNAADLNTDDADSIKSLAGAGKLTMSEAQWEKISYGTRNTTTEPDPPTEPETPPTTEPETEEESTTFEDVESRLSASDLDAKTYTDDTSKNGFIVKATTDKTVIVSATEIDLKGAGAATFRSIHFTAESEGKLEVQALSSDPTRKLQLWGKDGKAAISEQAISADAVYVYDIPEKGEYYIKSGSGGIKIKSVKVTGKVKYITKTLKFRATSLDAGALTEDKPSGEYFTVKKDSEITENEVTVGEETFTKRVKFSGEGGIDSNSIQIKALGKGTLTIYAASSSDTVARTVNLLDAAGAVKASIDNVGEAKAYTVEIPEKGIYYITSAGSELYLYGIDFRVTYKEGETVDDGNNPAPPEPENPETEGTTFVAPEGDIEFGADEGNDLSKVMYNMEGYAAAANVTGGGLLTEDSQYYKKVTNEKKFLDALQQVRDEPGKPHVIEVVNDLNLGSAELKEKYDLNIVPKGDKTNTGHYTGVIRRFTEEPRMHPTLIKTGASYISMNGFKNLTIFSKNGAMIKHAGIKMEGTSQNIILRNLTFDELWEWDEGGKNSNGKDCEPGDYDINDWDYINIDENSEGIWIDHCTFYKAYDGLIDLKNKKGYEEYQRVTISWCEFLPGSKDNVFFNIQMKWLEDNINNEEVKIPYYRQLRKENMQAPNEDETMSAKDVWWYVYGQKKAHLLGSSDEDTQDKAIRVTFANNYYKNANSRLPRLRYGKVHEYNCVFDSQQMNDQYNIGNPHITGNGAISTCGGEMLLENCYIRGVRTPLRSGYKGPGGYINAVDSVYYSDNNLKKLQVKDESTDGLKITDKDAFIKKLTYKDYIIYDATQLYTEVVPHAGAGKLDMSTVQWEKTKYGSRIGNEGSQTPATPSQTEPAIPSEYDKLPTTPWDNPENPTPPVEPVTVAPPTASPASEATFESKGGEITLNCADDATIYYTISDAKDTLTDPADEQNKERKQYTIGTTIQITKETYICAVAVKDGKTSEPLNCHYIVLPEGAVVKPIAIPGSETQPTPVKSGDTVKLSTTAEVDAIYYIKGATPDAVAGADLSTEDSGREQYNDQTGIVITEAVTIKAVAKKGEKYSDAATFSYTIKTDVEPDPDKTVDPPVFSKAGGVVEKGSKITIDCKTADASIYYTTDGNEPKAEEAFLYKRGTEIVINKTMTIRAIAVKDGISSKESKETYTVKGTENPDIPLEPDDPGNEVDAGAIWVTGLKDSYLYTGAKIIPDIKVWDCDITGGDRLLAPGVDYTVTYKNNTKPADNKTEKSKWPTVIINGKGNYVGKKVTKTFFIEYAGGVKDEDAISVKGAKVELSINKYAPEYDGTPKNPDFKLVFKGKAPVTYEYTYNSEKKQYVRKDKEGEAMNVNVAVSNNVNKGTATILVTGKKEKNKVTSAKATFKIQPVDLSKATVAATSGVYAVKGAAPGSLTVTCNGKELVNGIDYTVKYGNNKKVGSGTITVTGKGNYTKKAAIKPFAIEKLDMSELSVNAVTAYDKMAAGKVKATVVDKDGNALKASQYTFKIYKNPEGSETYGEKEALAVGTIIYVEAEAKDKANLKEKTPRAEFKVGKDISKAKVVLAEKNKKGIEYTGSPITLKGDDLTVTLKGATSPLKMGENYEIVAYSNNINKGTATAVIRGIGDYSGTKTIKFKIKQRTMENGYIKQ